MSLISDERVEELLEKEIRLEAEIERLRAGLEKAKEFVPIYDSPNNRVRAAIAAEREACAKVAESFYDPYCAKRIEAIAAAIRARTD